MKREHNSFLTPLVVEVMPSGKRFRLYNDFTYRVARAKVNIKVPAVGVPVNTIPPVELPDTPNR